MKVKEINVICGCGDTEGMWGAEDPLAEGIDALASYRAYGNMLLEKLAGRYPDTLIDVDWSDNQIEQRVIADCGEEYPGFVVSDIFEIIGKIWDEHEWVVYYAAQGDTMSKNEYYECRNCGQVVQGFGASQDINCCEHPGYDQIDGPDA